MAAPDTLLQAETAGEDDDDDFCNAHVKALLQRAEKRLRQQQSSSGLAKMQTRQKSPDPPKLETGPMVQPYIRTVNGVAQMDNPRLLGKQERELAGQVRKVEDPIMVKERAAKAKKATAGSDWFDMPRTDLTPELKRDLQLLKSRSILDPHRHYKNEPGKAAAPEYSQVGTIIEGPTEYYSARIPTKERKRTFVEEVLAGEVETGRFKKKYGELQKVKTSGKKAHYKALKAKRSKGIKQR